MALETVALNIIQDYAPFGAAIISLFVFYNKSINDQVSLLKDLLKNERDFSGAKVSEILININTLKDKINDVTSIIRTEFKDDHNDLQVQVDAIRETVNRIEIEVRK